MKNFQGCLVAGLLLFSMACSSSQISYKNEPSKIYPFGQPHPDAPREVGQWAELIGECDCRSITRNPDGTWADTVDMLWRFKYILNGWGVQDESFKSDGLYSGSIRQYNADSSKWYVHYFSSDSSSPVLPAWEGNRTEDDKIILYRSQTAPNGMEGFYKISFYDIDVEGFNWLGEWVDPTEKISYPTWRIFCEKRKIP